MDKNEFLIRLSDSDRTQLHSVDFRGLSAEQQVFSAIWALESQVNSGGFEHYFTYDGDTAEAALAALRRIGAHACADIVARALRTVSPRPLPDDQSARTRLLGELDDGALSALDDLDQEFFAYPDDLTELLFDFVRSHPEAFGPVPDD